MIALALHTFGYPAPKGTVPRGTPLGLTPSYACARVIILPCTGFSPFAWFDNFFFFKGLYF